MKTTQNQTGDSLGSPGPRAETAPNSLLAAVRIEKLESQNREFTAEIIRLNFEVIDLSAKWKSEHEFRAGGRGGLSA